MGIVERCVDTLHGYFELGNSLKAGSSATFVSNDRSPDVFDSNCVTRVRAGSPAEIDALLAEVDEHYRGRNHRCFKVDPLTPPSVVARLVLEDYRPSVELQSVLHGDIEVDVAPVDIRPVTDESDWSSLARLIRRDHEESAARRNEDVWAQAVTDQMVERRRDKAPDVQFFLATAGAEDCAFFSSWPGVGGMGKVEDLFTLPEFRHRGIGTALIRHAVADARRRGAGPVLIGAEADDTPKSMYAALGFQPVLTYTSYVKRIR